MIQIGLQAADLWNANRTRTLAGKHRMTPLINLPNLEARYQELLVLRSRVRQTELLIAELHSVGAKVQASRHLAREKQAGMFFD